MFSGISKMCILKFDHMVIRIVCLQNLNNLAGLVRGVLPSLIRKIIGALITLDVHSRDVVTQMVHNKVSKGI